MITVFYDNHEGADGMRSAWGFSCLVEGFSETVLFDTGGDGEVLLHSMAVCGVDPETVDVLVISHNHWDHTGGAGGFSDPKYCRHCLSARGISEGLQKRHPGTGRRGD